MTLVSIATGEKGAIDYQPEANGFQSLTQIAVYGMEFHSFEWTNRLHLQMAFARTSFW